MAGAGAKKFPAFSKLSSDDVNNYLADQVIMRFATTTARDAAFGGAGEPTLAEGMTCYIDNLNVVQTYDGSNWVTTTALQTTSDVSSGLVWLKGETFSWKRPLTVDNVFTSKYLNYRLVANLYSETSDELYLRYLDSSGGSISTANYTRYGATQTTTGAVGSAYVDSGNRLQLGTLTNSINTQLSLTIDFFNPNQAVRTSALGTALSLQTGTYLSFACQLSLLTVLRGFELTNINYNLFGRYDIYGYNQ